MRFVVNYLRGPLRKQQKFTSTGSKGNGLWLVNFDPLCVFLCFKVHCLWSCHDWCKRKTQLWRRLLHFRVCMFLKSTVKTVQFTTLKRLKWWHLKHQSLIRIKWKLVWLCLTPPKQCCRAETNKPKPLPYLSSNFRSLTFLTGIKADLDWKKAHKKIQPRSQNFARLFFYVKEKSRLWKALWTLK